MNCVRLKPQAPRLMSKTQSKKRANPDTPRLGDVFTRPEVVKAVRKKGSKTGTMYHLGKLTGMAQARVREVYDLDLTKPGRLREAETLRLYEALFGVKLEVVYRVVEKE